MKTLDLKVRFETVSADRVKAFVNDKHIGNVSIRNIAKFDQPEEKRLVFRCNRNPFKNIVPKQHFANSGFDPFANFDSVEHALKCSWNYEAIVPIVIRNALRNFSLEAA